VSFALAAEEQQAIQEFLWARVLEGEDEDQRAMIAAMPRRPPATSASSPR
jgi:hypothetical protein